MTHQQILELRKMREDEVLAVVEQWPRSKMLIAYRYLNASGCAMSAIDYEIDRALKAEFQTE